MYTIERTALFGLFRKHIGNVGSAGSSCEIPWRGVSIRIQCFPINGLRVSLMGDNPTPAVLSLPEAPFEGEQRLDQAHRSVSAIANNLTINNASLIRWPWSSRVVVHRGI